ncbi:MAG: ABC transporter permease [Acidobacteriota bacterium]|nr:ABC transporter permease [Acidobacteriota bacterium]
MSTLWQDVKYAIRLLAKSPGFAVVAILTLALGIGANTAIFTLLDAVVLKTLPVPSPSRLVVFSDRTGEGTQVSTPPPSGTWNYFSYPLYVYLRDHNQAFTDLAGVRSGNTPIAVRVEGRPSNAAPDRAVGQLVSGNYFQAMDVNALLGRALTPPDDQPGAKPAAVISYGYWKTQFSGNPAVTGQTVILNQTPFKIVGVMPQSFFGERVRKAPDFWIPLNFQPQIELADSRLTAQDVYWLNLVGRLKPGESMRQANAIVDVQLRQFLTDQAGSKLDRDARDRIAHSSIELVSAARGISGLRSRYSRPLEILLVAVGLVLLIACANVANLLLARAAGRQKEISMRMALGASKARLVRQWLTESLVLAGFGAIVGGLLSAWGVDALVSLLGQGVSVNVLPDARVLLFALIVLVVTAILFGIAPALRSSRVEPMLTLREHSAWAASRAARSGLLRALVVLQVALSLWILVGAGLLARSLMNLQDQQFGFNPSNVLLVGINPRIAGYKPAELTNLYQKLLDRMNSLPGVRSATVASYSPLSGYDRSDDITIPGRPRRQGEDMDVDVLLVGTHYAETLGLDVLLGRDFSPQDTPATPKVAIVNEAFVRRFLPGQNPIGRRFFFGGPKQEHAAEYEIVGVVNDAKYYDVREAPGPLVFTSILQAQDPSALLSEVELRTAGDASAAAGEVRTAIGQVDGRLPITDVETLRGQVNDNFRQIRLTASVAGLFSLLALALAAVGLYGLLAYSVAQRTNEIGVRMALGARPIDVFRMVLDKGIRMVGVGLVLGIAGALALTRALGSLLYGVGAADPGTYVVTAVVLLAVAALACYVPAHRATRVDPATALRNE